LEIPAALGSVTGPGVYTATSSTAGELAFPITALAPPGSPAARVCTLSNGGMASTGLPISVAHQLCTPDQLVTSADCAWFKAEDVTDSSGNPVADGADMYYWHPAATTITSTVDKIRTRTGYSHGVSRASVASLDNKPAVLQELEDVLGTIGNTGCRSLPNSSNGWNLDPFTQPFTVAINMKRTPYGDANGYNPVYWCIANSSGGYSQELIVKADGTIKVDLVNTIPADPYYATVLTGQTVTGRHTYVFTGDGAGAALTATAWHNGNTATVALPGGSSWTWNNANSWSTILARGWTTDILFLDYAMDATQSALLHSWFAGRYGA